MKRFRCGKSITGASLVLLCLWMTGCTTSIYNWQVRTNSTPVAPSFDRLSVEEKPVAILPALSMPALRGTEVGFSHNLAQVLRKLIPNWNVVGEQAALTAINRQGLGTEYARMRRDAEDTHLLDRESLRKIGAALGVRYLFQPRLASFTQTMTERWKVPGVELRVVETRSSVIRLSLQLWEAETGELIWFSTAETILANEGVSQDPVFLEDATRVTLGSLVADFLNRRTSSRYTPLDETLNQLIGSSAPAEQKNGNNGEGAKK
ncbi:hypothetical protein ACO9S2_02345 [Nitrospira sp. NS4]|uniref:hypothetical protein n=1 Tax=Nitrospira sp. NS4 TaxID=3414498 RepID=UPI003C2FC3B7